MMNAELYHFELKSHLLVLDKLQRKSKWMSMIRLLATIALSYFIWQSIATEEIWNIIISSLLLVLFLWLLTLHSRVKELIEIRKSLIFINEQELLQKQGQRTAFNNGESFLKSADSMAADLDLFGQGSLFHFINRCFDPFGRTQLARWLIKAPDSIEEIEARQVAVAELAPKLQFRQWLHACGISFEIKDGDPDELIRLTAASEKHFSLATRIMMFVGPAAFITSSILWIIMPSITLQYLTIGSFLINLSMLQLNVSAMKPLLSQSVRLDDLSRHYSRIFSLFEKETHQSPLLQQLQKTDHPQTSVVLRHLSVKLRNLETVTNVVAAVIFNGMLQYHLHVTHSVYRWKNLYGSFVRQRLEKLGTFDALCSLANFTYNEPSFVFPQLIDEDRFIFEQAGHPLIPASSRVCNDISFAPVRLVILTGSNMSGKSTFLRTLGVNLLLGNAGAPVCAKSVTMRPVEVLTSLHQSDSLLDGESFFAAEVKRIGRILKISATQTSFVLLDEILRGTNSEDKFSGTMGVIKKLINGKSVGVLATHDLTICSASTEMSDKIENDCFESSIEGDELIFDYKLMKGVCKNRSATWMMEKSGVID